LGWRALLFSPTFLNKGMAFSEAERTTLPLHGLHDPRANLLPHVDALRSVAVAIARAVALAAREEGVCPPFDDAALPGRIAAKMWEPVYRPYRRKLG
jgi:malic enzyme